MRAAEPWAPFTREPFEYDAVYDLPAYQGPTTTYLLATTQRTGSHYLAHLLARTPWGGVPFEYVNRFRVSRELAARGLRPSAAAEVALLREMRSRRTGSSGLFGVKAHWHSWRETMGRPDLRDLVSPSAVVYLARRDRTAQAHSLAVAEQTGVWVDFGRATTTQVSCAREVLVDAGERIEAECAAWEGFLAGSPGPTLRLCYEDVRDDPHGAVEAVRRFLAAPEGGALRPLPMPVPTARATA